LGYVACQRSAKRRPAERAASRCRVGGHDGVEACLDGALVGHSHLVEDVVGPTALRRHVGIDRRQGGDEALAAVDADHVEALAGEASTIEIGEEMPEISIRHNPRTLRAKFECC
jgi:hypothetical protein